MIWKRIVPAAAIAALSLPALAADGIVVGYKDVVEPEPELVAFAEEIVRAWLNIKRVDPSRRDTFFAPTVKTFMKSGTRSSRSSGATTLRRTI
jgi:ABC-type taurine transport system substrate-binding protein